MGETGMLTTSTDNYTGGSDNNKIFGGESEGMSTLTVGDYIDGGAGTDQLKWTESGAITALPTGVEIKNVELIDVISGGAITLDTTSNITGMTKLTTANQAAQTLTASATQNVDATVTGQANNNISVTGGKDVKVTTTGNVDTSAGNISVTNAAGTVTTSMGDGYTDANAGTAAIVQMGDTSVAGGTKINVSSVVEFTDAQNAAAKVIAAANDDTVAQGAVTVTGNSSTTEVTVNQTAAVTATGYVAAVAGTNVKVDGGISITNGNVTITDANAASTTEAGTITTVTANSFGTLDIQSGALTTLNLSGTGTSVDADALGSLTTAANSALALNINGLTVSGAAGDNNAGTAGNIVIDSDIKTLNITSSNNASTVANLVAVGATTVNVAGNAKASFTGTALTAVKDIVVTNTAGAEFKADAIGVAVNFTGGAGDDYVVLSNAFEKAITMGAGDDTVVYGGAASTATGKKGSVDAGDGEDTIVMTSAQAKNGTGASADAVFNGSFTGFEVLQLSDALAAGDTIDLDGINGVDKVVLAAGGANATTSILSNMDSDGTVTIKAPSTGVVVNVRSALAGESDILNVELENSTVNTNAFGSITAANVETINITTVDTGIVGIDGKNVLSTVDTATLVATGAKSIVVSGDNGLNLTTTGNTKVTSFDASGVVGDGAEDTEALLAVTYASAATVAANTADTVVTIKGGAGNDILTGNDTKDTIIGGAGNDTITGGAGVDTITVGNGRDIIVINNNDTTGSEVNDSSTAAADIINGFTMATATTALTVSDANIANGATAVTNVAAGLLGDENGGENMSVLALKLTSSAGARVNAAAEGNATDQAGQATGVTYTVKDGILTLGGDGADAIDTLGEWLTEAAAVAATDGEALAFEFGTDTYVFVQNADQDSLVKLTGVTGAAAFVEGGTDSTTVVDNTIVFVDIA